MMTPAQQRRRDRENEIQREYEREILRLNGLMGEAVTRRRAAWEASKETYRKERHLEDPTLFPEYAEEGQPR